MSGLKRSDLQKCRLCGRGVMHSGQVTFLRMTVEHHIVDLGAVTKAHAMEQIVGSPLLAHVMGPDEDLSKMADSSTFLVCMECACTRNLAEVIEP